MYLFDFQHKLKKLNEHLYVYTTERTQIAPGIFSTGIYLKNVKSRNRTSNADKNLVDNKKQKYLEALETGKLDRFICGIGYNYVPEYEIFDVTRQRLLLPGWRSILLTLIGHRLVSKTKAKKVFRCSSLGESTYDKLPLIKKMYWATHGEKPPTL